MAGVKGSHVIIAHDQLGDVVGEDLKGFELSRVNAESVLDSRLIQETNEMAGNETGIRR